MIFQVETTTMPAVCRFLAPLAFALATAAAPALAAGPECTSNDSFLVVEVPHKDSVGNRYIVRDNRATPRPACSTRAAKGDVVVGGADDPYFLLKLAGPYLLIDSGTGPDRDLVIRDLRSGKTLYSGGYNDEDIKLDTGRAAFWAASHEAATKKNCPDFAKITKDYLTPAIETLTTFDFSTGALSRSGRTRCVANQ